MKTSTETKKHAIVIASVFTLSFYSLRMIFDKLAWTHFSGLLLALFVSVVIATTITYVLIIKKRTKVGLSMVVGYALIVFLSLSFSAKKNTVSLPIELSRLKGSWISSDSAKDKIKLTFFRDSLEISLAGDSKTSLCVVDSKTIKLFDADGEIELNWPFLLKKDQLILFQDGDKLVFVRQKK